MTQRDKLLKRLFEKPKNFRNSEMKSLLRGLGFEEKTAGRGSGVKFYHPEHKSAVNYHLPKKAGKYLPSYILDQVTTKLIQLGIKP